MKTLRAIAAIFVALLSLGPSAIAIAQSLGHAGVAVVPEQFAQPSDPDDTLSFGRLTTAINAGQVKRVQCTPGRTYQIFSTTPTTQSVAMAISGASGLLLDLRGCTINVAYTGNAISYIFELTNSNQVTIDGLNGIAATGKHVSGDITGVNWVQCSNQIGSGYGCTKLTVTHASINGGLNGVAISRGLGTGQFSHDIAIDGYFANVGYPVSNQADGLNTTFDIVTNNCGRSYIGYNVWGVKGRVNSTTGNALNDIALGVNAFQGDISNNVMANVDIEYVNRASTTYGASFVSITHQQADPSHSNLTSTVSNVHVKFDVLFNSTPSTEVLEEAVYTGNGTSQSPGDLAGDVDDNIVLAGKIEGDVSSTYLGCVMAASNGNCQGYSGLSRGTYNFSNLQIPNSTKPWAIGVGANITYQNYSQPNAAFPTFDGSNDWGLVALRQPVLFSGYPGGETAQGTTNFYDPTGQATAFIVRGQQGQWYNPSNALVGTISSASGNFDIYTRAAVPTRLGYNGNLYWNIAAAGLIQPITDNASPIGDGTHRLSNVFGVLGTFNNVVLPGSTAHSVVLAEGSSNNATANPVAAGKVLTDNGTGSDPTFQSAPAFFISNTPSLSQNTQNYCGVAACTGGAVFTSFPVQKSGTYKNLLAFSSVAPAAGQTYTITIYDGGLLAVTCTISNPATNCSDTTHTAAHTTGNSFVMRVDLSATAGAAQFALGVELDVP